MTLENLLKQITPLETDSEQPLTKAYVKHSSALFPELVQALQLCCDFIGRAHGGEGMTEEERWTLLDDARREGRSILTRANEIKL